MDQTDRKAGPAQPPHTVDLDRIISEIVRSLRALRFGSIEIVVHDSRVVQIERKEKLRFDRG
jgi:hypothetical protein